MNPWVFWMRQSGAAFVCFIVGWGVAAAFELVRDRIRKKNATDKVVLSNDGNELEVLEEASLQRVLQSLDDAREKVLKALQKAKNRT